MSNANDFAHPVPYQNYDGTFDHSLNPGLTKREHFAGLALQGLLSNVDTLRELRRESGDDWPKYEEVVGGFCTLMADALLAALNKPTK